MAEEEATATTDVVQHQHQQQQQQQQCNKPFCAVYAVENGHHLNKMTTRRRGGGGRSDDIHFHYDQNSYLSVGRTWNIFGSAGGDERPTNDGVGAEEEQQDNEMGAAAASWRQTNHGDDGQQRRLESLSPFFVRTGLTHCQHTDWDLLREVRVRELTEVRQRVTLMENTMRWWLSAAEQWREKWLKVKNERSRLREENLRLRNALSNAKVELHGLKSSNGSIIAQLPKGICCAETRCRPSSSPPPATKTVVVVPPMCEKINNDCTCSSSSSCNSSKRRRRRSSSV